MLPNWKGETVVCIGGGPSLTREQVEYCRDKARIIAINDALYLAPWADMLYFADKRWFDHHFEAVKAFCGIKVTIDNSRCVTERDASIIVMRNDDGNGRDGLCLTPNGIKSGRNGGYQAINLAVHTGAKRILLLGYDMRVAGKTHWFGDHPKQWKTNATIYATTFIPRFGTMLPALAGAGIEVINCTPGSALDIFPMAELEKAL